MTVAEQIASADCVVFSSSWCPYCVKAIVALKGAGIQHKGVQPASPNQSLARPLAKLD